MAKIAVGYARPLYRRPPSTGWHRGRKGLLAPDEPREGLKMRYRSLDTNLLVMLDIIFETRSVTKTGEIMGLSQPAISSALGRLREHFGDELLVQVGRNSVLTPLAERLVPPLKDLLARTDALIAVRSGFDPLTDQRRFSMLGSDYVATTFGLDIIRVVAMAGPNVSVELDSLRPGAFARFERGEIDMAILPQQNSIRDHPTLELFTEEFVCVVWDGHPEIIDAITEKQYLAARHVVTYVQGGRLPIIDEWFLSQSSVSRTVAVQVPSFSRILDVLPGTPFVATVQRRLAQRLAATHPLRVLPAPMPFPVMPILLQWHSHLNSDAGLVWFRSVVTEVVERVDRQHG